MIKTVRKPNSYPSGISKRMKKALMMMILSNMYLNHLCLTTDLSIVDEED